jgi:hypothetical protein
MGRSFSFGETAILPCLPDPAPRPTGFEIPKTGFVRPAAGLTPDGAEIDS